MRRTIQTSVRSPSASKHHLREGLLIASSAAALFIMLALTTYRHLPDSFQTTDAVGRVGGFFAALLTGGFGYMAFLFPVFIVYGTWLTCFKLRQEEFDPHARLLRSAGFILLILAGCGLAALHGYSHYTYGSGGILGRFIAKVAVSLFSFIGAAIVLLAAFFSGITLATGFSWLNFIDRTGETTLQLIKFLVAASQKIRLPWFDKEDARVVASSAPEVKKIGKRILPRIEPEVRREREVVGSKQPAAAALAVTPPAKQIPIVFNNIVTEGTVPSLELLDAPEKPTGKGYSNEELEKLSREVELRLQDFGITVQVVAVHPGPVVTRFEMQLAAGIKVSRITTLAKDLARSLSAISVRVVEVIPGKAVVGLELPNKNREIVRLQEILASQQYQQSRSALSLGLGKDIAGHPVVVDLAKMPHLLVAGTTGSGKSVCLNALLLSLLYKAVPEEVRLIMIDPKMLELSIYEGIPHLLAPVVTDMKEAANALRWCVAEMDRRYKIMSSLGVRNLAGYNQKIQDANDSNEPILDPFWKAEQGGEAQALTKLPYVVVLVDEFADMIMVVGKKVEELIARIAQKARAAGIHLILATQRPSVDVITGLIKANIPTRIGFQVSSKIDSRTILDQQGAEQLLGYGDMLYLAPGSGVPVRVHGAYVADHEVHAVVADWKKRGKPEYMLSIIESDNESGFENDSSGGSAEEQDPLYDQAVQIVVESRRASISNLQRRLKIGYNRAANLIEAMEVAGLVSPMESNGNREILVPEGER